MFDLYGMYGMESDNDDIELDPKVTTNDETAVDEAGDDMETVDVSPDTKETAHNEEASAGGISTGDNQDDLEMDPVAATEAYVRRRFGLSVEDVEEANEQTEAEAAELHAEIDDSEDETDPAITTVNVVAPAGGETEIVPAVADAPVEDADELPEGEIIETPIETASDVASLENLRYIYSYEDDGEPDTSATADVEFDVKTQNNDVNFQMEDKAITIEPNAETTTDMDTEPAEEEPVADSDEGEEEPAEEGTEGAEEGGEEEPAENPEAGNESWNWY